MRPTEFFNDWTPRDRELARALILHERLICPGCGQPTHETHDPDREGWYDVETVICAGCRAAEQAGRDTKDEPGAHFRVSLNPAYIKRS